MLTHISSSLIPPSHFLHMASTNMAYAVRLLLAATLLTAPLAAQASADSLRIRLQRAEAAIETLQKQLAEQATQGVKSRSRADVEIFARVLGNGFINSRRTNNVDNPQFVRPDTVPGFPQRGVGIGMRQTRIGASVNVPEVWTGAFSGDIELDFSGGQQPSSGGRTFPLVRLRTARGIVRWQRAEFLFGQESPLVSGLNPVSPSAIGTPLFAASGNLWLWLPQVRFGMHIGDGLRFGFQVAALAPTSGDAVGVFETDHDLAERSQRPYVQSRLYARWGDELVREVGCGFHLGWLAPVVYYTRVQSDAITCDFMLPVNDMVELRGELFTGAALRGLGGGGIGQNFTPTNSALPTRGGWAQLNLTPLPTWRAGGGCGTDQPDPVGTRHRNDSCAVYAMLRPPGPIFLGTEFRRTRTGYAGANYVNDHVTLTLGFEF
jgi:hypothetical protein